MQNSFASTCAMTEWIDSIVLYYIILVTSGSILIFNILYGDERLTVSVEA